MLCPFLRASGIPYLRFGNLTSHMKLVRLSETVFGHSGRLWLRLLVLRSVLAHFNAVGLVAVGVRLEGNDAEEMAQVVLVEYSVKKEVSLVSFVV